MKRALLIFMLSAASTSCESVREHKDVKELFKQKGSPTFTAKSMDARGNVLVCHNLELFEGTDAKAGDSLCSLVLLYCEPWDGLWLWAAYTDIQMRWATPYLKLERPGAKFSDEIAAKKDDSSKLLKPVRVFAALIDDRGRVVRTSEIIVHELQIKE